VLTYVAAPSAMNPNKAPNTPRDPIIADTMIAVLSISSDLLPAHHTLVQFLAETKSNGGVSIPYM
jgi:hypothetical protein